MALIQSNSSGLTAKNFVGISPSIIPGSDTFFGVALRSGTGEITPVKTSRINPLQIQGAAVQQSSPVPQRSTTAPRTSSIPTIRIAKTAPLNVAVKKSGSVIGIGLMLAILAGAFILGKKRRK